MGMTSPVGADDLNGRTALHISILMQTCALEAFQQIIDCLKVRDQIAQGKRHQATHSIWRKAKFGRSQ